MADFEKYFPFTLTDEQKELVRRLLRFIDSDKKVFIVKGYAGTGKTSIMFGLVKHFGVHNHPFTLMASTGRAAKVMAEKARFPAGTVHATIYAMVLTELMSKSENPEFRISFRLKMPNFNRKLVFFVDESSMLSNHIQSGGILAYGSGRLIDDLFAFAGKGKVVFIGDPAQLPPVNTKFSAALSSDYLKKIFDLEVEEFELKQVMRYKKTSGIYFNTTYLRHTIYSGQFPQLSIKTSDFDDMQVYYHDNDLVKKYYETIKTLGLDSAIYITLSNKQAAIVNNKVRNHLWGSKSMSQLLKSGESVMVVRNNYLYNLSNGDLITVDSVEDREITKADLQFKYINIRVADPDPEKGLVVKRVLIITNLLTSNVRDLSAEQEMALLKNFFARMRAVADEIFEILNTVGNVEQRREEISQRSQEMKIRLDPDSIIEQKPSKKALFKTIAYDNMQTDPYLNALRVKYGYAITCHKAQGSEWPHVFVHLERSMFYLDKENQHRWVYTALSRAEKKIHILHNICLY